MRTEKSSRAVTARMVTAGVFAAVIFVATMLHINIGNGGYVHMGDAFLYLAACVLPLPYAMTAGAIGEMLSDALSAPIYIPATIVIKAVLVLFFTAHPEKFIVRRNVIGLFLAGITGLAGYFLYECVIYSVPAAAANLLIGWTQPAASGVVFLLIGSAFDRAHLKQRLFRRG